MNVTFASSAGLGKPLYAQSCSSVVLNPMPVDIEPAREHTPVCCADAFEVMLTRVSGILLGVFLSVVLAMVIFPKSASHQATDSLASALWHLEHLSRIAWNSQFVEMLSDAPRRRFEQGDEGFYVPLEDGGAEAAKLDQDRREAECEKVR